MNSIQKIRIAESRKMLRILRLMDQREPKKKTNVSPLNFLSQPDDSANNLVQTIPVLHRVSSNGTLRPV